jgi:NAD+ kinase
MIIGIAANLTKEKVYEVISILTGKLNDSGLKFLLSDHLLPFTDLLSKPIPKSRFTTDKNLYKKSDMIISVGGDGTMLDTSYKARIYDKPVLGLNIGKLGFLAEVNIDQIDLLITEIQSESFTIEERMVIEAECLGHNIEKLYGINDIVIDKGGWPKMIELNISVNSEYLTNFVADGVIAATPTGSTGYSLSTGGPVVSPKTDVLTLSPISPHSLTMRPFILPGTDEVLIKAVSLHKEIQVNCDGQRVFAFKPPLELRISKSDHPLKLIHTSLTSYFKTLRKKLLWGIDQRQILNPNKE